jgi:hypothetical protein
MSSSVKHNLFNRNGHQSLWPLISCSSFLFLYFGGDDSKIVDVFDSKEIDTKIKLKNKNK